MIVKITLYMDGDGHFRPDDGRMLDELNPKEMLLYAAADCAGRTIVSLLKEHTSTLKSLTITLEGTLSTPTVVAESTYTRFHVTYRAECHATAEESVISRAINLANDKYCGMLQMLRKIAPTTHEISIVATN